MMDGDGPSHNQVRAMETGLHKAMKAELGRYLAIDGMFAVIAAFLNHKPVDFIQSTREIIF